MKANCKGGCGRAIETRDNKSGVCRTCKAAAVKAPAKAKAEPKAKPAKAAKPVKAEPKPKAAKAPKAEPTGRRAHAYSVDQRKDGGDIRPGTQRAAVYAAVKAAGPDGLTAADVLAQLTGKVTTTGDLNDHVRFYLTELRRNGYLKKSKDLVEPGAAA